jgi:hypothetical protein
MKLDMALVRLRRGPTASGVLRAPHDSSLRVMAERPPVFEWYDAEKKYRKEFSKAYRTRTKDT